MVIERRGTGTFQGSEIKDLDSQLRFRMVVPHAVELWTNLRVYPVQIGAVSESSVMGKWIRQMIRIFMAGGIQTR
jgi:hypothetical protein